MSDTATLESPDLDKDVAHFDAIIDHIASQAPKRPSRAKAKPEAKKPAPIKVKKPDGDGPEPCVGLPVQFQAPPAIAGMASETLPAVLQRRSMTDPDLWDVKVMLSGVAMPVVRIGVRLADEPTVGCWNFLPGWRGT